jgi:ribosomal protein S18 acetylase RimI-like enzyme
VFHIREAQIGDAVAITFVHIESWKTTYKGIVADSVIEGLDKTRVCREKFWSDVLAAKMKEHILFIAEDDEKIVGFVNGGEIKENIEGYDSELYAIYLLQSSQGKGIGRKLTELCAKKLHEQGYQSMLLWVLEANKDSRSFYEHIGAKLVAESTHEIAGKSLKKLAYGWSDIRSLIRNEG